MLTWDADMPSGLYFQSDVVFAMGGGGGGGGAGPCLTEIE